MKNIFIKTGSFLMILMLLATVSCGGVGAESILEFSDVTTDYWGYQTIMDMTEKGIFKGTTEAVNGIGTFSPEKVMTRAEFVTASLRSLYGDETEKIENDSLKWWNGYYLFAIEKGIVKAEEFDSGDLDKAMTREEMAMIMVRCVEQNGEKAAQKITSDKISDYSKIQDYYKEYVIDCFSFGLLCGIDENGTFAPSKSLTRAEAATVICRLLDKNMRVKVDFGKDSEEDDNETFLVSGTNDKPADDEKESEEEAPIIPDEPEIDPAPWKDGGKIPSKYSWEEYQALNPIWQEEFFEWFESPEEFEKWQNEVLDLNDTENVPWENGGKMPEDYTWEEFCSLTTIQQDKFFEWFESPEAFEQWQDKVLGLEEMQNVPWENGGKMPEDYTWEEFQDLTTVQQDKFFEWFESPEAFEQWQDKVLGLEEMQNVPWENGGKMPEDYTWEEFQNLTTVQQDKFFEWFESPEAFEQWQNSFFE
ncbi:MAG: S-layer homology domain-containing protein [Ruminococcaceae bacterium]|nr:S-layer homology domain-containing protein [Oscillospiraceae bacterium]